MMREYAGMAETNIEELRARVEELEAALRYYADGKHYTASFDVFGTVRVSRVEDGEVARKALGEVK